MRRRRLMDTRVALRRGTDAQPVEAAVQAACSDLTRALQRLGATDVKVVLGFECQGISEPMGFGWRGFHDPMDMRRSLQKHTGTMSAAVAHGLDGYPPHP